LKGRHVVWYKYTNISNDLLPPYSGKKASKILPDYAASHTRKRKISDFYCMFLWL